MKSFEERFWEKVEKNNQDNCWLWKASLSTGGYGRCSVGDGIWENAHRVSYRINKGDIPDNLVVRHKCDVRNCVNPNHLEIGTMKDNTQDMIKRGRHKFITPSPKPGELNPMSKLSNQNRKDIYNLVSAGRRRKSIAEDFGISRQTVDNIMKVDKDLL